MKLSTTLVIITVLAAIATAQVTRTASNKTQLEQLVTARKAVSARPLSTTEKLGRARQLLAGRVAAKALDSSTVLSPVTLSVNQPLNGSSSLKFNLAAQVIPGENDAFFQPLGKPGPSGVLVGFNAPVDGYYIFDFSVNIYPGQSDTSSIQFQGIFNPEYQQQTVQGHPNHLIFITKEVSAGKNYFFLNSDQLTWDFYSVDISQFKLGN